MLNRFSGKFQWIGGLAPLLLAACTGTLDGGPSRDGVTPYASGGSSGSSGLDPSGGSAGGGILDNDREVVDQACAQKMGVVDVGLTRLRRLTRDQLNNSLRDLTRGVLGAELNLAGSISPDELVGPFHSNATAPITELVVQQHQELAVAAAALLEPSMGTVAPCDLAGDTTTGCITQFVQDFGARAYRRPLVAEEVSDLVDLYTLGQQASGAEHGFSLVLGALLQAPSFMYHADSGNTGLPSATPVKIDGYGLASRLSYFLWNSMPDDTLFQLAANATILDEAVLTAQVDRMLQDPKAAETVALFHRQWLGVGDLLNHEKNPDLHPDYGPELASAMLEEQARFAQQVVLSGDGLLSTLLTAGYSYPSAPLFAIYGLSEPAGFAPGQQVTYPAGQRAGLLTQAAFLTRHAKPNETSPVHRGLLIRENLLCHIIESPPANVDTTLPPKTAATTTRERFEQHLGGPCASCHVFMDPIGLGFENYDEIGRYRTVDGDNAVDATGEIVSDHMDLAGPFNGAVELAGKLAQGEAVADCVARQWFRMSLGRTESVADACSVQSIVQGFDTSGGNVRALLAQIALSEAFQYVRATAQVSQ